MNLLAILVVGLIAGYLTHLLMKTRSGIIFDMLLGVLGGFVGGWLTSLIIGQDLMSGINLTSVLVAVVGSIILVFVYRLVTRKR